MRTNILIIKMGLNYETVVVVEEVELYLIVFSSTVQVFIAAWNWLGFC